jgi:hypothetical protein
MPTREAVDMIRATTPEERSRFAHEIWNKRRRNPEAAAGELATQFHGRAENEITEIRETVHEHEYLAKLATLTCLRINTESGYKAEIRFPKPGAKKNEVYLAASEDGTTMYFTSGEQAVDLKALHMDGKKWQKDLMVLGRVTELEYFTAKKFDNFVPSIYWHKSKEGLTPDGTKHTIVSDVDPILLYDTRSCLLQLAGGQYSVEPAGVVG